MMNEDDRIFNLLMEKYGIFDYTKYLYDRSDGSDTGYYRWAGYHDGAWLEGYYLQPVIYWGA